jgi:hypothetical protein
MSALPREKTCASCGAVAEYVAPLGKPLPRADRGLCGRDGSPTAIETCT